YYKHEIYLRIISTLLPCSSCGFSQLL
ncbi:hypothetical protein TNCT_128381, partial [Trichonephila clavata]